MFLIYDEIHCDHIAEFETREAALDELRRLSTLPWEHEPNRAPCKSWRTCERDYQLIEFEVIDERWRELSHVPALNISHAGVNWHL